MKGLFAGLDVSTQSCKLVVIDLELRDTVFVDAVNYDEELPQYGTLDGAIQGLADGVSESDPHMWIEAVELLLARLRDAPEVKQEQIRCISVSGQQHGLVAVNAEGQLARPRAKLWNDYSTSEECDLLTEKVGGTDRMIDAVANPQRPGYTASKIFHMLRHEPECYAKAAVLFLVHNYINWFLTGGADGGIAAMEPGDTSGSALWNPVTRDWSKVVLNAIDPGLRSKLPSVTPSDRSIGDLAPGIAAKYGLSTKCLIDAGSGDNMYGAVGTGNFSPGIVTVSLGTSGTAYTFLEEPYVDPEGEIAAFCDSTGHHLPLLCVSNMANGYNAVLERFALSHDEFDAAISRTKPGNGLKVVLPWYGGERTPDLPNAAPVYFGFDVNDFGKDVMCRAVLEGHVLNLHNGFRRLPVEPTVIHLTGGLSQSLSWCQMIADVFEAETVPVQGEGAALGAAIHAAWVWLNETGRSISLAEVAEPFVIVDEEKRRTPIPANVRIYEVMKRLFRAVSNRVRGVESIDDPFELYAQRSRDDALSPRP